MEWLVVVNDWISNVKMVSNCMYLPWICAYFYKIFLLYDYRILDHQTKQNIVISMQWRVNPTGDLDYISFD